MTQGRVKCFNAAEGIGFITPDDHEADIFVHHSHIAGRTRFRTLEEGQHVEFEIGHGVRGPQAENVRPI